MFSRYFGRKYSDEYVIGLKKEIKSLQKLFLTKDSIDEPFPIAYWSKTIDGVIISMNGICYQYFIKPTGYTFNSSIGSTDHEIFSKETADVIRKHDFFALDKKEPVRFLETLEVGGVVENWIVVRIPILNEQGIPIFMKGMAYKQPFFYENT